MRDSPILVGRKVYRSSGAYTPRVISFSPALVVHASEQTFLFGISGLPASMRVSAEALATAAVFSALIHY